MSPPRESRKQIAYHPSFLAHPSNYTELDYENDDALLSSDSEDTRAIEVSCLLFTEQCNEQGNVIVMDADILQQLVGEII